MRFIMLSYFMLCSLAQASTNESYRFTDSPLVENLFVRVYYPRAHPDRLALSDKIDFCVLTKSNAVSTIYFPKPEYICELELSDSNRMLLPQTRLGRSYGKNYAALKAFSFEAVNKRGHNTGGSDRPDVTISSASATEGRELPPIGELFTVKKAGEYKLLLKFQVFKMIGTGPNHTFKVIKFPEIEIKVGKPGP